MAESTAVSGVDWLYPDLMSEERLLFILKQRFIRHAEAELESLSKEELVELYNCYILPLPQRKYRSNRRGQEMTRKQLLLDKSLKRECSDDGGDHVGAKKAKMDALSSGLINHISSSGMSGTRLKPPPSLVNFENKVVKLNSSKTITGTTDSIVIEKRNQKPDGLGNSTGQADSLPQKRLYSSSQNEDKTQESPKDNGPSPKKAKIAKITWP